MKTKQAEIIALPKIYDPRGSLTVAEGSKNIPFLFKKVVWRYSVGLEKGILDENHAQQNRLFVALSGSFRITLGTNGSEEECLLLNQPYQGLWVKPGISYRLYDFSHGAVCLEISDQ